jgi:3-phenylpropionate/trans-cinnamate dioxygenase ferredoxin reductase component
MDAICIIGAGDCGARAAFALRENGFSGAINLINAEKGIPYERPPLSKPDEHGQFVREIAASERYDAAKITLLSDVNVTSIDRRISSLFLSDSSVLAYDRLLIATGATPRDFPNDPDECALSLRTKDDAEKIYTAAKNAKNAVIIGAGLIGLELAAELRGQNIDVTIVEMAPAALGRAVPKAEADRIVERHISAGVRFIFDAKIDRLAKGMVALEDGEKLSAELIVSAIGVSPNIDLAESAGLDCGNGILTSSTLATSDPKIFAAGDCACFDHPRYGKIRLECWRNALEQGECAALAMLGGCEPFQKLPWFWSDQYELGLQVVGRPDPADTITTRDLGKAATISFYSSADGVLNAAVGLGVGNAVAKDIRLAEMLIEKGARPPLTSLTDPTVNLKKLLRS